MAGVKISQLQDAGTLQNDDQFVIARSTLSRRLAGSDLLNRFTNIDNKIASLSSTADAKFVQKAGDTMTGFLTLNADPTANLHSVTKQYVDTLVNQLSSNMMTLNNVPYARLVELPGQDTAISNLRSITGSTATNTNQPAQLIFPISTAVTLTRNLTFIGTPANYIDTIGITKNGDRSIRFSTTGTYEIYVESPSLSLHNFQAWADVDIRLIDSSNNVILAGTPISLSNSETLNGQPTLRGRFSVTNTSTNYFVQIRRNQAGQSYGLCAAIPDVAGAGVLFTTEIWKLA